MHFINFFILAVGALAAAVPVDHAFTLPLPLVAGTYVDHAGKAHSLYSSGICEVLPDSILSYDIKALKECLFYATDKCSTEEVQDPLAHIEGPKKGEFAKGPVRISGYICNNVWD